MALREEEVNKITSDFIKIIESGTPPWRRPWQPGELNQQRNALTGRAYHGFNEIYLTIIGLNRGYSDPRWLTYKQAKEAGGYVRKGEKGTKIIFFTDQKTVAKRDENGKVLKDSEGKTLTETTDLGYSFQKTAVVFNASQVEGIEPWIAPTLSSEQLWENEARAEKLIVNSEAKIYEIPGSSRAFYSSSTDSVTLPSRKQFESASDFYSVLFHELSHWTGHPTRLNREVEKTVKRFGKEAYAQEELRAELGQFLMCQSLGIGYEPHKLENTAAYLDSWSKVLQDQPKAIIDASFDARKIEKYLMQYDELSQKQVQDFSQQPETKNDPGQQQVLEDVPQPETKNDPGEQQVLEIFEQPETKNDSEEKQAFKEEIFAELNDTGDPVEIFTIDDPYPDLDDDDDSWPELNGTDDPLTVIAISRTVDWETGEVTKKSMTVAGKKNLSGPRR